MASNDEHTTPFDPSKIAEALKGNESCLLSLSGVDAGRLYNLQAGYTLVGRGDDCDILLNEAGSSRRHARLLRGPDGKVFVNDLDSTNGTRVNGRLIGAEVTEVTDGDQLRFGDSVFTLVTFAPTDEIAFRRQLLASKVPDDLTGLSNRFDFRATLEREFKEATASELPLAVIAVGIDDFDDTMRELGLAAGEYILRCVANLLSDVQGTGQLLARGIGPTFLFASRVKNLLQAVELSERLRHAAPENGLDWKDEPILLTLSAGVACTSEPYADHNALVDTALAQLARSYEPDGAGRSYVAGL